MERAIVRTFAEFGRPGDAETRSAVRGRCVDAGLVMIGAGLSLLATGFVFGLDNSLFQLPILGRLYDLPQFASDPFIQSLRYYASGFWRVLEGSDRWIEPVHLLLALSVISRIVAIAGFLVCARLLGVRTISQKALFVALVASADLMLGYSYAGSQGLFFNQASHSELANGLLLLSLASAARGRLALALTLAGAVFFCNAFMGAWTLVVIGGMAVWLVAIRSLSVFDAARRFAFGLPALVAFAAPVVATIVRNPDFGQTTLVDYRDYLTGYWPKHFLIGSVPTSEIIGLLLVIALGVLSYAALGRRAAPFRFAFAGFIGLYLAGVAAPFVTGSPTILNLHLLRTSGPIQMLATLASLALATRWATGRDAWRSRLIAPGVIVALCALPAATLIALVFLVADGVRGRVREAIGRVLQRERVAAAMALGCGAVVCVAFVQGAVTAHAGNLALSALVADWRAVGVWARDNTAQDASFLTPAVDLSRQAVGLSYDHARAPVAAAAAEFEYLAHRQVYVDFKRGGAAPWTPSYYAVWRTRIDEVLALNSLTERRAYAARVKVRYVVDICGAEPALFRAGSLCVYGAGG